MTNLTQHAKGSLGATTRPIRAATPAPSSLVARPIVKWAGGKAKLAPVILPLLGRRIRVYREPFAGGAAVFFALAAAKARGEVHFERAVLSDANAELENLYVAVRDNTEMVIAALASFAVKYEEAKGHSAKRAFYERIRASTMDNAAPSTRAARLLFLNRTCFNGLYRVNSTGKFNVPMGRYTNPRILDAEGLRACSRALQDNRVEILHQDATLAVMYAGDGDAVYADPPYVPASKTANFTSYTKDRFGPTEQNQLALRLSEASDRGARCVASNGSTPRTARLYRSLGFRVKTISAARSVGASAATRKAAKEILAVGGPDPRVSGE